jgi:predicted phage terminase large subunit-like protein
MPAAERAMKEQLWRTMEFQDQLLRTKGKEDLYIFNKWILDVEQGKEPLAPFHRELCNFVQDNTKKKKLILIPRGHLKSTLITIGYSVFKIINNPNIRILILNATWQMAVDFLTEIKNHLTKTERLQELFLEDGKPWLAENPTEWSQDRITLQRTNQNIKGPTVWAAGIESNLVGSHPDLIIFDDVQVRENTQSREQIEKVILRYKDALDLLEPGGQLIVIGTRWVEGDFYSWLMDKDNEIHRSYDIMVKTAYEGNIQTGEEFKALWPEKFTKKELEDRLREKGSYEFSAQYMNNPIPEEDATFKRSQFQYFNFFDIRGKEMTKIMTIDPAISEAKTADYTAIVVSGLDMFGNIFVLDIIRKRMNPSEIIETIFDLQSVWHVNQIGIETIAYQKALAYTLKEEIQKRKRYLPITEIKSHDKSKDQRIKGLQPSYEAKNVWHRDKKELPNIVYLEDELLAFPRAVHDDIADAFSMQLDLLYPPRKSKSRYQQQYLY